MTVLGYFAAIIMGLSLGMIGGGGSILTVPILFYFFRQPPLVATTNSLFVVGSTALIGAVLAWHKGIVDFKTGVLFAVPSFLGVYLSRHFILPFLPEVLFSLGSIQITKALFVMIVFAILMIAASKSMIQSGLAVKADKLLSEKLSLFSVSSKGLVVGATTGFVGAGGGFLIIPSLVLLLKMPMRIAVGTSLAIIAANSLFGFFVSARLSQETDWLLLLGVSGLGILGIFVGQRFSSFISEKKLKVGFGVFVLAIGSFILMDQILRLF